MDLKTKKILANIIMLVLIVGALLFARGINDELDAVGSLLAIGVGAAIGLIVKNVMVPTERKGLDHHVPKSGQVDPEDETQEWFYR